MTNCRPTSSLYVERTKNRLARRGRHIPAEWTITPHSENPLITVKYEGDISLRK